MLVVTPLGPTTSVCAEADPASSPSITTSGAMIRAGRKCVAFGLKWWVMAVVGGNFSGGLCEAAEICLYPPQGIPDGSPTAGPQARKGGRTCRKSPLLAVNSFHLTCLKFRRGTAVRMVEESVFSFVAMPVRD